MFLNETHLPQILNANQYFTSEQYELELKTLFMPGWHCIGTVSELPKNGDFITRNLLGHPVIIWRNEDDFHGYLNVCAHRQCMLSDAIHGHTEKIKCQYHGWEYDVHGDTCRIPDAKSFRPLSKGSLALIKFRTQICGQLIFISLSDNSPSLEEFLGPVYKACQDWASSEWKVALCVEQDLQCNWKLVMENVVENYHLDMVHPKSFRKYPEEERCHHQVGEHWTHYQETGGSGSKFLKWQEGVVNRILNYQPSSGFQHFHAYPHVCIAYMGLHSWFQMTLPTGSNSSRTLWYFFCYSPSRNWRLRLAQPILQNWSRKFFNTALSEDAHILLSLQQGLQSPKLPGTGLISTREERIHHFQKYIHNVTEQHIISV